jgi:hypothetical protein
VWDKLSLVTAGGQEIATLDRQAFAMTASYDLKRADGQKFGRGWACFLQRSRDFTKKNMGGIGGIGIEWDLII